MSQISNMPNGGLILAVDGPSGTGKSTTCRTLAKQLDAKYVDTGAMYRVATLAVLRAGVDPSDTDAVIEATRDLPLEVSDDPDSTEVLFDGENVAREIREREVTQNVSAVSAIPEVRVNLVELQRKLAHDAHRAIVEGRDIGTVVLVDAPAKAFLTASPEVRATRRYNQDAAAGRDVDYDTVLADVIRRDELDSSRATSPLRPAEDAAVIDTSEMGKDDVLNSLIGLIERSAQ
ncbi:(d)CMP kinase [Corynebacterium genitalium ATCC 33030]|uniref:Cytidylate kinase n=1 Tax=Corynebacterium genitalium ATCC 33030 TaxID=585529 RepID=D7WCX5_9CORY|nr:(d)CMP kinase [Corynebacterium genitalium]EFK54006.1 cytidylate kinase [Corynebacterium genitalium ATCC 33030]UUA88454.1 (d)CMP kinase [Corynebacterium genitalium ATCC 33030]